MKKEFKNLDWFEIIEKIKSYTTSELAKVRLESFSALRSPEEAQASFADIAAAQEVLSNGHRPHMQSLDLFSTWHSRLKKNAVLKTLEIRDTRSFCLEVVALKEALSQCKSTWARDLNQVLMAAHEPLSAIDQLLTPQGDIRMDASETLYRLSKEKDTLFRQVETQLDRLVKDHQIEHMLQERYVTTREGRWVLPVKGGMKHYLPGVVHGASQTKQTVYIEPETVVPLNNRIRQIEIEIEEEIERLLIDLSRYLFHLADSFEDSKKHLEYTDVRLAQAQLTTLIDGQPCEFNEEELHLIDIKHPLLLLSKNNVIGNTVRLDQKKSILLLSGPNAGGKTVLLKSIGLAAQMARCGLPIPAEPSSKIPFFMTIHTGIGDSQSVDENLSTFAAHVKILNEASLLKGPTNLILIDEICGSTDPEEGSALARSFIERFSQNKVFAIITSHLSPLKVGWSDTDRIVNGSLEYDSKSGRPTYQFIPGIPGDSLALQTAKRVGVDPRLIERALEFLSPALRAKLNGLEEVENLKSEIAMLQQHLKKEIHAATQSRTKYEKLLQSVEAEKENILKKTMRTAQKQVDEAIQTVKAADTLNKHRSLQEIKYNLPEIVKAKSVVVESTAQSAQEFGNKYPPGSKVYIPALNQDGLVQSSPNNKGEVQVLSNSIRLNLMWSDLKPPEKALNPTAQLVRKSSSFSAALVDNDRTVDLRGKTVEEALEELEIALDKSSLNKEDRIKIIHGHGTEALKRSVRTYLSRSVFVKKWKAGSPETGGDGITWAELSNES